MTYTSVTPDEFVALDHLDDWRVVVNAIHAEFRLGSFAAAATFVGAIAAAAESTDHHPDVDVRYPDRVRIALTTLATGGVTIRDVDLARQISALAVQAGATSEPKVPQLVEVAIDTVDADRIRPFWAAVLGYRDEGGYLVDPARIGPPFWFQTMTEPRRERSRFHIDVSVPHDEAEQRISAALAAGGRIVTTHYARSWWVLADADGNEACVCTWQDRN
jgi:4a-hydroxytetrahydrobiopterin dehydratase